MSSCSVSAALPQPGSTFRRKLGPLGSAPLKCVIFTRTTSALGAVKLYSSEVASVISPGTLRGLQSTSR